MRFLILVTSVLKLTNHLRLKCPNFKFRNLKVESWKTKFDVRIELGTYVMRIFLYAITTYPLIYFVNNQLKQKDPRHILPLKPTLELRVGKGMRGRHLGQNSLSIRIINTSSNKQSMHQAMGTPSNNPWIKR